MADPPSHRRVVFFGIFTCVSLSWLVSCVCVAVCVCVSSGYVFSCCVSCGRLLLLWLCVVLLFAVFVLCVVCVGLVDWLSMFCCCWLG